MRFSLMLCLMLISTLSQNVFAGVYKCKTSEGKIIYSENPCEGATSQQLKLTGSSSRTSSQHEVSSSKTSVAAKSGKQETAVTETETASNALNMSEDDKQSRIQGNIAASEDRHATPEKKADALDENKILNKKVVNDLDHMDEVRRKDLKSDLDSIDQAKRYRAAAELRAIYSKY